MVRAIVVLLLLSLPGAAQSTPTAAERLVAAAYAQIGVTRVYDPSYRRIAFPGGDVPLDRGVCSDVVVRAYRGIGTDLQRLVNDDMRQHFAAYPQLSARLGSRLQSIQADLLPRAFEIARLAVVEVQAGRAVGAEQAIPVYLRDEVARAPASH